MFGNLKSFLGLFQVIQLVGPLFVKVMNAESVRDKVAAAFDAAREIAKLTTNTADDEAIRFIDSVEGRADRVIDLIADALGLIGIKDGPIIAGSAEDECCLELNDVRAAVMADEDIQKKADEVGVPIHTLITITTLIGQAIKNAPAIVAFFRGLFPRRAEEAESTPKKSGKK